MMLASINELLCENEEACVCLQGKYEEYSYLWKTDMEEYCQSFYEEAVVVTKLGQKVLDLAKFDQAISKYEVSIETDRRGYVFYV